MSAPSAPASYRVQPVETAAQRRLFLTLPDAFYVGIAEYIRPNDQEVEAVFDPQKNKLFAAGGEAARWLLLNAAGQAVGRIAAFVNPTIQAGEAVPVGGFGFFECLDDPAAAHRLLDTARAWLTARGMQAMDGPVNFGERDRFWGLHVDGFDRIPSYGMFYHRPYYQLLLESYGLQLYFKQFTYVAQTAAALHPRLVQKAAVFADQPNITFAHARKTDIEALVRDMHRVYSLAWGGHSGTPVLTVAQVRRLVQKMRPVLDEKILWFAYDGPNAVAFFISIPGLNQIFQHTGPNLNAWGKLKFVWERFRWERRRDKLANGILYGVVPDFQSSGVDAAMLVAAQQSFINRGYKEVEMSWIGDFNPKMMTTCRAVGGVVCKTHHTYRLYFDPAVPFARSPIIGREKKKADDGG